MKKFLLTAIICTACYMSFSQSKSGEVYFNAGLGIGNTLKINLDEYSSVYKSSTKIPPIFLSVDFNIAENFSVGGFTSYSKTKSTVDGELLANSSFFVLGARGLYHFETESTKFKPYVGAMLGYKNINTKFYDDELSKASGVAWGVTIGSKYMLSEKAGLFAELGYGTAILNFGFTTKLK